MRDCVTLGTREISCDLNALGGFGMDVRAGQVEVTAEGSRRPEQHEET